MKITNIILTLGLIFSTSLVGSEINHSLMNHSTSNSSGMSLMEHKTVGNYMIMISSNKPLTIGDNTLNINITQNGKNINALAKIKVFMPEMPGMPYMEEKQKFKILNGKGHTSINFAMNGTWQYQLKFKIDNIVKKVRGSFNL